MEGPLFAGSYLRWIADTFATVRLGGFPSAFVNKKDRLQASDHQTKNIGLTASVEDIDAIAEQQILSKAKQHGVLGYIH